MHDPVVRSLYMFGLDTQQGKICITVGHDTVLSRRVLEKLGDSDISVELYPYTEIRILYPGFLQTIIALMIVPNVVPRPPALMTQYNMNQCNMKQCNI